MNIRKKKKISNLLERGVTTDIFYINIVQSFLDLNFSSSYESILT